MSTVWLRKALEPEGQIVDCCRLVGAVQVANIIFVVSFQLRQLFVLFKLVIIYIYITEYER